MRIVFIILFTIIHTWVNSKEILYPIAKNGKWGLISAQNEYILHPTYDYIEYDRKGDKFIYYLNNKKGIINKDGQIFSEPIYEDIQFLDTSYLSYKVDKKWNLFQDDKKVLKNEYDSIQKVSANNFILYQGNTGRLYNGSNQFISEKKYHYAHSKFEYIIATNEDSRYDLFEKSNLNLIFEDIYTFNPYFIDYPVVSFDDYQILLDTSTNTQIGKKADSIRFLNRDYYYQTIDGQPKLYRVSKDKYYQSPYFESMTSINYPYLTYLENGKPGVWDFEKGKNIIEPKYQGVRNIESGDFFVYNLGMYGVLDQNGEVLIPVKYESINTYDNFYVVKENRKSGIISLSGKEIEPCKYGKIKVFDTNLKCYNQGELSIISINQNGSVKDKKTYSNYMSIAIEKERLPRQRSTSISFEGDEIEENRKENEQEGWFQNVREITRNDSTYRVKGKWGLYFDKTIDSIAIRPRFKDILISPDKKITKAYFQKRPKRNFSANNFIKTPSKFGAHFRMSQYIVSFYDPPFILVDNDEKSIISNQRFISLNLNDFDKYELARGMVQTPVLADRNGQIIRKDLSYYGDYSEDLLIIAEGGKYQLSKSSSSTSSCYVSSFGLRTGAISQSVNNNERVLSIIDANWYILDRNGKQLNEEPFQFINEFHNDRSIVKRNNLWGVIDSNMNEIVPIIYGRVEEVTDKNGNLYYRVTKGSRSKFIYNKTSGSLDKTQIKDLKNYNKGTWFAQEPVTNKWALMDTNLKALTPYHFDFVFPFINDHAIVVQRGRKTLINNEGQQVLPLYKAKKLNYVGFDKYSVLTKKGLMIVNTLGDTIVKAEDCKEILEIDEDYIAYKDRYKNIHISNQGREFRTPKKTKIISYSLSDKSLLLEKGKKRRIYSLLSQKYISKNIVGAEQLSTQNILFKSHNNKFGLMNLIGDTLIKEEYIELSTPKNGWLFAKKDKRFFTMDTSGNRLLEEEFFKYRKQENTFLVYTKEGVGILDENGKWLIPAQYKIIKKYNSIFYKAINKWGACDLYDLNGNQILPQAYSDIKGIDKNGLIVTHERFDYLYSGYLNKSLSFQYIKPVSSNLFILQEQRHVGLYNFEGDTIIPVEYHSVDADRGSFQVRYFNSFGYYQPDGSVIFDPKE